MNQQAINMPYKSSMPFGSSSSNVIHSSGNSYNSFGGGGGKLPIMASCELVTRCDQL